MRQHRIAGLSAFWLTAALLPAGCNEATSKAQQQTQQQPTTIVEKESQSPGTEEEGQRPVAADSAESGKFDPFFPKPEDGYAIVLQPENPGYAQASLQGEGDKELAVFSIFDTENNPVVSARFERSDAKFGDYPVLSEDGSLSALIAKRYHVQVRSVATDFGEAERQAWLEKFDLAGIAKME